MMMMERRSDTSRPFTRDGVAVERLKSR